MLGALSIYSVYGRNERWVGDCSVGSFVYLQRNGQQQSYELAFMLLPSCLLDMYSSPGGDLPLSSRSALGRVGLEGRLNLVLLGSSEAQARRRVRVHLTAV